MDEDVRVHEYHTHSSDPELSAIEGITDILRALEPHARYRILMYLADRWAGGEWPDSPMDKIKGRQ